MMTAGIMGYLVAASGQMLMNGSGRDFFYICVLLGFLRGVVIRTLAESEAETKPEPATLQSAAVAPAATARPEAFARLGSNRNRPI